MFKAIIRRLEVLLMVGNRLGFVVFCKLESQLKLVAIVFENSKLFDNLCNLLC